MRRKSSAKEAEEKPPGAPSRHSEPKPSGWWERLDPFFQKVLVVTGVIAGLATSVGVATGTFADLVELVFKDDPDVAFVTYADFPVAQTQFGKEVPAEINRQIPEHLRKYVNNIEISVLGCDVLDAVLREVPESAFRNKRIQEDKGTWRVQMMELRQQSEFLDEDVTKLLLTVQGESQAEVTVLVREVSLKLHRIDKPPRPSEACLYAWVQYAVPFIRPPLYAIAVPATAKAGDVITTSRPVSTDYVGIDRNSGVLIFEIGLVFEAPGGYDFSIDAKASEAARPSNPESYRLYDGRYGWMVVDKLEDWRLYVDWKPPEGVNFP